MRWHMALHKHRRLGWVDATGQIQGCCASGISSELAWIVGNGDGMEVHHTKKSVVAVLEIHPVADRPQPVSQVQGAGGLKA